MNKEIFKQEESDKLPAEQVDQENPEQEPEQGEWEKKENGPAEKQAERQESLDKAREELDETYKKQEADSEKMEEQERLGAGEFFQKARMAEKEGNFKKPPLVSRNSEAVNNIGALQEVRNETAKKKVGEVLKALEEIYGDLKNIKENVKIIMDIGAGWGENLRNLVEELEAEKGIAIDNRTVFSKKVKEEAGSKLMMVSGDALEEMKRLKSNSLDLSTAIAFLQVLNRDDKIKILRKVGEVSELVVVVDELKRSGLEGLRDLFISKLYNAGMGKYEVLKEEEWNRIFEEAGLVLVEEVFNKFGKNGFVAVLKRIEGETEE